MNRQGPHAEPDASPARPSLVKTRSQIIFAIGAIVVVAIFAPFTYETVKALEALKKDKPEDYHWPEVFDLWPAAVSTVMILLLEKLVCELVYPCYYKICKEKKDEKIRVRRTKKGVKNIFKLIYFVSASLGGWYTLKDSFILPSSLGGSGNLLDTFKTFPYVELPTYYRLYFTSTMGYHIGSTISHFFAKEKDNDYVEMMFHHLVTFYLYAFSFLTNTFIGGVVAYIHDISDIFIALTRSFSETEYKISTVTSFIACIGVWFYTRLYVFPTCIYYSTIKLEVYAGTPYLKPIFGALMSGLFLMHVYWFLLLLKILISCLITGQTEDLAND